MAHNLNNIIVDRVLRGIFTDKDGNVIFSLNQIQDLSLNQTSESQEVTDAFGVSIMELMRSKALEASANNAIYDFGLLAAQYGTEKKEVGESIVVPTMESFEVPAVGENGKSVYELKHTPIAAPTAIYALNGDSTLGDKYVVGTDAASTFAIDGNSITLPSDVSVGTEMLVMYEYTSTTAVEVVNSANNFAKMGKMTFEILAYDLIDCILAA